MLEIEGALQPTSRAWGSTGIEARLPAPK